MRFVRLAILCLVLGFVTTVAVAWGLAAWLPQRNWEERWMFSATAYPHNCMAFGAEYHSFGATRRWW